jgi:hypothetical protein
MADHYARSTEQLTAADVHKTNLSRVHARIRATDDLIERDDLRREVGVLANKARACVKAAEVHALLAISQGLDDLITAVEGKR